MILQILKYFFPTSCLELTTPGWSPWLKYLFFQASCLLCKTLSAELRLFIAQSTDCLIKAQANPPQRHRAQDSSRSSPKLSNKIIRGLFPGPSTKHQRKQRGRQWGGGEPGQSPPKPDQAVWGTALLQNNCPSSLLPGSLAPHFKLLHSSTEHCSLQLLPHPVPVSSKKITESEKCCAMVKKYKLIWKVLQKRPTFGDFFPVAFLDAEQHFQFPTLTLTQFLHLHLIQQFQWPGHRGCGKPAQARASSPEIASMKGFVGPNTPDPTAWLAL